MDGFELFDVVDVKFPWTQTPRRGMVVGFTDFEFHSTFVNVKFNDHPKPTPCYANECAIVSYTELFGVADGQQN